MRHVAGHGATVVRLDEAAAARRRHSLRAALLDTDPDFARLLASRLRAMGADCRELTSPPSPAELTAMRVHVLIVDPSALGDASRYLGGLCAQLPHVGVLVCARPSPLAERVGALRLGVDDWITKPCHVEEIIARGEAVARRRRPVLARESGGPLAVGGLVIHPEHFQAYADGVSAELTRREFELLQVLAHANGAVLRREEIYARVWGFTMSRGDRSVDVFVRKVRRKLDAVAPGRRYIHTHFGIGYRLAASPARAAVAVRSEIAVAAS
jgi:DNA-binding response OmpR family regulator